MMVMKMLMGWDYVSELRPLTGLFFIPRATEYGERRWNDIDRLELLIRPAEQSSSRTVGTGKKIINIAYLC
jgi:hypothetical protein